MSAQWTPLDFVTNGEFCEPRQIQDILESIRRAAQAECALLLVFQAPEFFRALSYVSDTDKSLEPLLQRQLAEQRLLHEDKTRIKQLLQADLKTVDERRLIQQLSLSFLQPIVKRHNHTDVALYRPDSRPRLIQPTVPLIGVVLLGPAAYPAEIPNSLGNDLAFAVNASAPVYLRRQLQHVESHRTQLLDLEKQLEHYFQSVGKALGNRLRNPWAQWALSSVPALERFLATLLRLTRSTQGGVFFFMDDPVMLRAITRLRVESATNAYIPFHGPDLHLKTHPGIVTLACNIRRPVVINDHLDFERMHPRRRISADPHTQCAEIAFPILITHHRSKSPDLFLMGAINIERTADLSESPDAYTLMDFLLVQEWASRLGTIWTWGTEDVLYQGVRYLERRIQPIDLIASTEAQRTGATSLLSGDIPYDYSNARDDIRSVLRILRHSVPTISYCSVRVLTCDQLALRVLVTDPDDFERCIPPIIMLANDPPAPFARVLTEGRVGTFLPGEIASSSNHLSWVTSYPLWIGSRCIGVASFGTRFAEDLNSRRAVLESAVNAIGEALSGYESRHLAGVIGRSVRTLNALHELNKLPAQAQRCLSDLISSLDRNDPLTITDIAARLSHILHDMDCLLSEYRQRQHAPLYHEVPMQLRSIRDVCQGVLAREACAHLFDADYSNPSASALIESPTFDMCLDALRDVVANAKREISSNPRGSVKGTIICGHRKLGGREYGLITLENPLWQALPKDWGTRLYREPLRYGRRTHFGCFLSAMLMRAVGGDIYVESSTSSSFAVSALIPLQMK